MIANPRIRSLRVTGSGGWRSRSDTAIKHATQTRTLIPNVSKIALSIVPSAIACVIRSKIPFENPRMNRPAKNSPRRNACPMFEKNGTAVARPRSRLRRVPRHHSARQPCGNSSPARDPGSRAPIVPGIGEAIFGVSLAPTANHVISASEHEKAKTRARDGAGSSSVRYSGNSGKSGGCGQHEECGREESLWLETHECSPHVGGAAGTGASLARLSKHKYINAQTYFSVCTDSGRAASPNWVKRKTIEIAGLPDNEGAIPYFRETLIVLPISPQ